MENYRVLERLGKGGQGSVYLAENKIDGSKYVLKKVECQDESDANQAFREAVALQKLKHPYVCGYKEFFVMWDKDACAMFLCIVMDYYTNGDLRTFINEYQKKQEAIDEETVKKFLGQIMEALIFVHRQGILHRDLKPSNIFIKDDGTLCLGDFGVSTIIGDVRTNTRCPAGTTNYMAPEVGDDLYDERSDLWSLGCILFEVVSTCLYNGPTFAGLLKSIQSDSEILEESFEQIAQKFSGDLIKAIRSMLKPNPDLRLSPEKLVDKMPYVRSCLEVSDSSQMEKRKRQLLSKIGCVPLPETPMTAEAVLEHLAGTIDFEECVKESLGRLLDLFKQKETIAMNNNSKRLIVLAMDSNMADPDIQIAGCDVLSSLVLSAKAGDLLFTPEIITVIPKAMQAHPDNLDLQQACITLLMSLSDATNASMTIGEMGGIKLILAAMRNTPDSPELMAACCNALWSLSVHEDNMLIASDEKAIVEIADALSRHQTCANLVEAACAAIVPLCLDDSIFKCANDLDLVGIILTAISHHTKKAKVIRNGCMALASLCEPDEECAFRVLAGEDSASESPAGIPIIMKAYELHKDNAQVVEAIVGLFAELVEYDEIKAEMICLHTGTKVLSDIYKHFKHYQNIVGPCIQTLEKLGEGGIIKQKK